MPKKLAVDPVLVSRVAERLAEWGKAIHATRVTSNVTAKSLSERIEISESTLRRMEAGDDAVSVGNYLRALFALGVLDLVVPPPDQRFTGVMKEISPHRRAINPTHRSIRPSKANSDHDDYF